MDVVMVLEAVSAGVRTGWITDFAGRTLVFCSTTFALQNRIFDPFRRLQQVSAVCAEYERSDCRHLCSSWSGEAQRRKIILKPFDRAL